MNTAADDEVSPVDPPPTHDAKERRRRVIAGIVTVLVLVVVFAGILPKFGNYAEAWDLIKNMSIQDLAVLASSVIFSIMVYVFPFQVSLPGLHYWPAFMIRQTSFTISNAVPAGGAVGLGVQYGMLAQAGFSGASATAAIGITSVFNLMITLALPVLGVLALLFVGTPTSAQVFEGLAGLAAIAAMIGFFVAILHSEENARKLGNRADIWIANVMTRFHKPAPASVTDQLVAFRDSTVEVVTARWALLTATNFLQQFAQFGVLLVSLRIIQTGESAEISVAAAFAAFALARLAAFIPVTPGGLGTVDAALTGLLVAFGVSNTDALAATLLWRAASWIPQVLLGVVTFLIWRARSGKMKADLASKAVATSASATQIPPAAPA